jgi:hypothetical protein
MGDDRAETIPPYVDAAAALTSMPLTPQSRDAVTVALTRIASLAAHVGSFPLGDDVEIAGVFRP